MDPDVLAIQEGLADGVDGLQAHGRGIQGVDAHMGAAAGVGRHTLEGDFLGHAAVAVVYCLALRGEAHGDATVLKCSLAYARCDGRVDLVVAEGSLDCEFGHREEIL